MTGHVIEDEEERKWGKKKRIENAGVVWLETLVQ